MSDRDMKTMYEIASNVADVVERSYGQIVLQWEDGKATEDTYAVWHGFSGDYLGVFAVKASEARAALDAGGNTLQSLVNSLAEQVLGFPPNGVEHIQSKIDRNLKEQSILESEIKSRRERLHYLVRKHGELAAQLFPLLDAAHPTAATEVQS